MPTLDVFTAGRPAVLGHRGASAYAADNSAEAFRLAREQGAAGVELDVRRTGDDVLVIHHDASLPGHPPLVEMSHRDARSADPGLLTFEEAMAECAGLVVNIEIKNSPRDPDYDEGDGIVPRVASWVRAADAYDNTVVSSFNPATAAAVRAADPSIATGLLIAPPTDPAEGMAAATAAGHRALHPFVDQVDEGELLPAARDAGLWIVTWTVDDPDRIRRLASAGINGLIVNDPAAALTALDG